MSKYYLIPYAMLYSNLLKRFAPEYRFRNKNGSCWSSFFQERPVLWTKQKLKLFSPLSLDNTCWAQIFRDDTLLWSMVTLHTYVDEIYSRVVRARLAAIVEVATVLGSNQASSDTVEPEGRQMKQCWIKYKKVKKSPLKLCIYTNQRYSIFNLQTASSALLHYSISAYI